jgi:hypothetical protein
VVVLAVVKPVNERPAERGSMLGEQVDRLGDQAAVTGSLAQMVRNQSSTSAWRLTSHTRTV